jgi:hypothetical protein
MKNERKATSKPNFTDEELEVFADFSDALRDGKKADIEEYVKRLPGAGTRLRKLLEDEVWARAQMARLRADYPGVDLARLLDPDWRRKRK